jgi:hypothetical protein
MTSVIGGFLTVRGICILLWNDQIAEVKQFISEKGFVTDPIN